MQRTVKYIIFALFVTFFLTSCGDGVSLQRYFVDNQESKNFISQDVPLSMIEIDQSRFNEEQREAYESVNRLNFLAYRANDTNIGSYNTELSKVNSILKHKKYNDLIEFNDKGNKVVVKYIGDNEEAEEVVVFANANNLGFAIVRVLGNNMSPDKMVTLVSALRDSDFQANQIKDIMNFFK
ncbi:DUF4252 domain-containing protein [Aestuariivivens sp. NBU2969]|uniref:DUF4252 domain-containing protein n=1 Tax=Aestuariivivens sp. NBU2969 TaxID=2873267 RepID=UPI001CBEEB1A|nr:DUF4252 domain-containing protein [Aestuariivivens sp. NBU2969]